MRLPWNIIWFPTCAKNQALFKAWFTSGCHNTQPYLNPFANLTSNSGLTYQEISPPATYQSKNEAVLNHSYSDLNANQTINASATYQENPDTAGTKIAYPDTKPYSNDTNPNLESIRAQVDSAHDDREEIK